MKRQRLWALFMAAVILMFIPSGAFGGVVSADSTQETFTVRGHGKPDIIRDNNDSIIPGYGYCLDGNASSPTGQEFTRMRLSEAEDYEKPLHYKRAFTDDVKSRLLKAVIADGDIRSFKNSLDLSEYKQWFLDNIDALYDNGQFSSNRTFRIDERSRNYGEMREMHDNGEISDEEFEGYKNDFANEIGYWSNSYQYIIWALVHGEEEWDQWLRDDGSVTGSSDRYNFEERRTYYVAYAVDDPIAGSDEHSLWNAIYKPVMDYIDNELPDYFEQEWDAWVYYTEDEDVQNILGAPFKPIFIKKVDADSKGISGAELAVKDSEGNIIDQWTSDGDEHELLNVYPDKTYTLTELTAPEGYTTFDDITFTLNDNYDVICTDSGVSVDGDRKNHFTVLNSRTSVSVSKVDIVSGEELAGAHIQILDENEDVFEEWDSTTSAHIVEGLKTGVTYTLRETVAPDGYTVASDTTFSIGTDGTVTADTIENDTILIEDSLTEVKISKTDIADGKELEGAHIQIIDEDEKVVEEWDSTKEAHTVTGLTTDKTYTLRETVAPEGYTIASDTTFTIDKNGNVTSTGTVTSDGVVLVEDTMTSVKVSKVDIADGKELEGAHIQIIDENSIAVAEWTSTKTPHTVKGLTTGKTYTLRETVAPEGYTVASDTTFTIDKNGKVTSTGTVTSDGVILIEDDKTSVKVDKVDGDSKDKLSGAEFILCDGNGSVIKSWVSDGNVFEVNGLKPGDYVIKELIAPKGYKIAENVKFTIDEKGQIVTDAEVENGAILVKDYVVNINTEENEHHADVPGTYPGPDITIVRTDKDTPAPALVVSIYPDGSTKDPASGRHTDDGIVREDVANDESLEEVDSGAAVTESGDVRTETGIFAIAAVMAIAFAVGVLTRKRAK